MHLKNASGASSSSAKSATRRPQMVYSRRARTLPCLPNSLFPNRFPVKSIKSLNIFSLAEIFEYLEYKDLVNCRLVCTYWKRSVDYHLGNRTHFAYGKPYNVLPNRKGQPNNRRKIVPHTTSNIVLKTNLMYACENCNVVNRKMQQEKLQHLYGRSISPTSDESSAFSPCLSLTPITATSPAVSPIGSNYCDDLVVEEFEYRCPDCQLMMQEFQQQLENELKEEAEEDQAEEQYYEGYIDDMNLDVLESILRKMPRLTALKFAQGYRYNRIRQSCIEVSSLDLIPRTFTLCPALTRIDLSNCIGLVEADFTSLVELYGKQLRSLNLSGCRIDEFCLRVVVKGCDRLRYLNVANNFCGLQGGCFEWMADSIETIVADYNQNVRVLDGLLQGKGRDIIELELNVGFCLNPCMPYNMIGNHFNQLISLKITFKSFGSRKRATLVGLSALKELECLYLMEEIDDFDSESSLDDDSVLPIMQSTGTTLRELYLHAASSLFGGSSCLTDTSMVHVHLLCPLLEVLSLKRAAITDLSLDSIARLRNAHTVQLIDLERISERGVTHIMSSFKQIESQELESIKQASGVDVNVAQQNGGGPKIEKVKRHFSLTPEMEAAIVA